MRKRFLSSIGVILALTLALVAGCGQSGAQGGGSGGGKIVIGQVVPLTGEAVESGKFQKNGAALAVEQINAAGGINGKKLEIVIEDDQTTNPGAVAALQKLLQNKDIVAMVGSIRSTQVQAMLPTIAEAKVPVMIGGTNYGLTHAGNPWVFRFRPHDGMSAKVIAAFLVDEQKKKKVGVIHATDAFGTGGKDFVVEELKKKGADVVLVRGYNNGEKDFTAILGELKRSGADGLVTYMTFSTDLGIMAKQLKQLGVGVTWVGSPSITAVDGRKLAAESLYGTFGITDFHTEGNPVAKKLGETYKAKFNETPDLYAAWTYDAVLALAEALKKAPSLKPDDIRKALLGIQGFQGAEGRYDFDENGDGLHHYHVVQNQNGDIKLFKTIQLGK